MRLHALIWAGIKEIPAIGIEYDPKITAYLELTGQLSGGKAERIDSAILMMAFQEIENDRKYYQARLIEKNKSIANYAAVNKTELENLIRRRVSD
jgi:polysaccharide pyruvyl transferase WcaK-like protein